MAGRTRYSGVEGIAVLLFGRKKVYYPFRTFVSQEFHEIIWK